MDPISALSLTVNIFTLVDVAVKTGKTLRQLYKATSGFTKQTQELVEATSQFEKALAALDSAQTELAAAQGSGIDNATAKAAERCGETARALKAILDQCRVNKPSSTRSAVKGWLQSNVKHKSKLEELQMTLDSTTKQLTMSLAIATRTDVARMRQLLDVSDKKQARLATQLKTIGDELPKLDENTKLLETIKEAMILSEESLDAMSQSAILQALRPATADKRFWEIRDPAADTFAWILEPSLASTDPLRSQVSLDLAEWLKAGSGVFHIAGKPGCGKSTLMKFLAAHNTSDDLLRQWATADGKQLILSGFFFWKLGTDEQNTMRGLKRGILYDIIKKNPEVAKLVLPEHWAPRRYASRPMALRTLPEPEISDGHVEAAFVQLLSSKAMLARFKICLFIDGLDEFDEPVESLWSFASKLATWTDDGHVKLCVSSREETPILQAFSFAQRITLHQLTESDVQALVNSTLDANPLFQNLAQSDPQKGLAFRQSIVKNAQGVFLWVVLLLKWVEEELAAGASYPNIERLVKTAPRELDVFFARILKSIPKHHARGACFILAMMLRVHGYCIGRVGLQPVPNLIGSSLLSAFGLSYIFDAFDGLQAGDGSRQLAFPVSPCVNIDDYTRREEQTGRQLQSWCKGFVGTRNKYGFLQCATFTHRAAADFLAGALKDMAAQWHIDDSWVAEGTLTVCLAEAKARCARKFLETSFTTERLKMAINSISRSAAAWSASAMSRIFALLDEIDAARQGSQHCALEKTILVGLPAFSNSNSRKLWMTSGFFWWARHNALSPVFVLATCIRVPLVGYVMAKLENPQVLSDDVTQQLLMLAAILEGASERIFSDFLIDASPIVRAVLASGISLNVPVPLSNSQNITLGEWRDYVATGRDSQGKDNLSSWRFMLHLFLLRIASLDKGTVPNPIWNELQVWLEFGAEVPFEVLVFPDRRVDRVAVSTRYPGEAEANISRLTKKDAVTPIRETKRTTLSSMIRWHGPPNMEALLEYTDPVSVLTKDVEEWEPLPLDIMH